MTTNFVRRVDQLDAVILDEELLSLLNTQYRKAFKYLPNSFLAKLGPEIDILYKLAYKYLPLHFLRCSFGQDLFQLQYKQGSSNLPASDRRLQLLALTSVCVPWIWDRIFRKLILTLPNDFSTRALGFSYVFERHFHALYQILTLINFCVFLQKSTYQSVVERILRVRPLYVEAQSIRSVQNDNVDRELLWHGLSEFLGFALPLINVQKLKGFFKRTCLPKYYRNHYKKYFIQNNSCAVCGSIPNFPHTIGCSHVFCYYCISSILVADPSYLCLDCDIKASGIENLKPLAANK
ncbi:hypothetical protein JTE90_021408 [Oedothorax gibbosus]|uniref:RING-type E3 ubiquitin transferase (cysteine targeting) n=1 Tax=Oedothorax gibbosus TaxID=931172 RepID=A0AAV6VEL3_9ARAC|nr:hypothetical protein JTE90_021408 [Oedothorax gibbosus]